jgi:hypothetical protein
MLANLNRVLQCVPVAWVQLAHAGANLDDAASAPLIHHVALTLMQSLAWPALQMGSAGTQQADGGQCPARALLPDLSVRLATALLLHPVRAERHMRWALFVAEAEGAPSADDGDAAPPPLSSVQLACMHGLLKHVWRLGWHNDRKELFWRLLVNGLPFSSRFDLGVTCACGGLGAHNPGRVHHFWGCGAAQAVLRIIARECGCSSASPLLRRHVWLMLPPPTLTARFGQHLWVRQLWRVVCLAALNAMWTVAQSPAARAAPAAQAGADGAATLSRMATLRFRLLLDEFAMVGKPPRTWERVLPADAPFFRCCDHGTLHNVVQWD